MNLTRLYLKKWWAVIGFITTFILGIEALGVNLIDHYCSPNSLFLGINFSQTPFSPYCGFIVIFIHVTGVWVLLFTLALLADGIALLIKRIMRETKLFFSVVRPANFMIVRTVIENEVYVVVHNDEFWLQAEDVYVETEFSWNFDPNHIKGKIKWDNKDDKDGLTTISRKKHKLLHFVTLDIENNNLIMNFVNGRSEIFPLPDSENPVFKFPITISGKMYFLNKYIEKVMLFIPKTVVISYTTDAITVKIE